jgi:hypothetical protein
MLGSAMAASKAVGVSRGVPTVGVVPGPRVLSISRVPHPRPRQPPRKVPFRQRLLSNELGRLRDAAARMGLRIALPALDTALTSAATDRHR